jgi:hypothetical protein
MNHRGLFLLRTDSDATFGNGITVELKRRGEVNSSFRPHPSSLLLRAQLFLLRVLGRVQIEIDHHATHIAFDFLSSPVGRGNQMVKV